MVFPPSKDGTANETSMDASFAMSWVMLGALGIVYGLAETEDDATELPRAFIARTAIEYESPLVKGAIRNNALVDCRIDI